MSTISTTPLFLFFCLVFACCSPPEAPQREATESETPATSAPAPTTVSIAIVCSDIDRSLLFYTQGLGMNRTGGFAIDEVFGLASGLSGGAPFHVERLQFGEVGSTVEWKLVRFADQEGAPLPEYIQSRTGVQYLTLIVASVSEHLDRLAAIGVTPRGETPLTLPDGRTFALVQDPDGLFVGLIGGE